MKSKYGRSFSIGIVGILGMLIIIWSFSCGNQNNSEYQKRSPDSVRTWTIFTTPAQWNLGEGIRIEFIDRKTKDTTFDKEVDAETKKVSYKRDTSYWIYAYRYAIDSITKKAKIDSVGRPIVEQYWYLQLPKENIKNDLNNYTP